MGRALNLAVLFLLGCSRHPSEGNLPSAPGAASAHGVQAAGDQVLAAIERGACFGICPVYRLTVRANGVVSYEGTSFVKVKGHAEARLDPGAMARLRNAFAEARFGSFGDFYETATLSDGATTVLSFGEGRQPKTVRHNSGDLSAPRALSELERRMEQLVEVERWIGTDAERIQNVAAWR